MIPAIDFFYKGALVRRFHTYNVLRQETVGHHSHGVAMLVDIIYPDARKELLQAALCHDLAEGGSPHHGGTGDTPGHIKRWVERVMPGFKNVLKGIETRDLREAGLSIPLLTDEEQRRLKFCDNVHGVLFCLEEISRGNGYLWQPLTGYMEWIDETPSQARTETELSVLMFISHRINQEKRRGR